MNKYIKLVIIFAAFSSLVGCVPNYRTIIAQQQEFLKKRFETENVYIFNGRNTFEFLVKDNSNTVWGIVFSDYSTNNVLYTKIF